MGIIVLKSRNFDFLWDVDSSRYNFSVCSEKLGKGAVRGSPTIQVALQRFSHERKLISVTERFFSFM